MTKSAELFASLTKDMSKGVNRLMAKPDLLKELTDEDLNQYHQKLLLDYNPKSAIGQESKQQVLIYVAGALGADIKPKSGVSAAEMIEARTCMLRVKVPQPGFNQCIDTRVFVERSKDPKAKIDVKADDGTVGEAGFDYKRHTVVQKLFGKDYLSPLVSQRAEFFAWLERHAVRSSLLGSGFYLVPHSLIPMVIEKIEAMTTERNELIDEFEGKYEDAQKEAKLKLGIHFDPSRYPDFSEVRSKFDMYFRWQDVNPAAALKTINKAAYEREVENAKIDWESTFEDIRFGLRAGFTDLTLGFAEAMGNDEAGKPKVFHASKVEKLRDFLETFEARDLTNDDELASLAKQAKELISTVDPKLLRKDFDQRKALADAFTKIRDDASKLVEVRSRKLNLDDE